MDPNWYIFHNVGNLLVVMFNWSLVPYLTIMNAIFVSPSVVVHLELCRSVHLEKAEEIHEIKSEHFTFYML